MVVGVKQFINFLATGFALMAMSCGEKGADAPQFTVGLAEQEFLRLCSNISDYDQTETLLSAESWSKVLTDDHQALYQVVRTAIQADSSSIGLGGFVSAQHRSEVFVPNGNFTTFAFKKGVDNRDFYILLSKLRSDENKIIHGCGIYDFIDGYKLSEPDEGGVIQGKFGEPSYLEDETIDTIMKLKSWDVTDPSYRIANITTVHINDSKKAREKLGVYGRAWNLSSDVMENK